MKNSVILDTEGILEISEKEVSILSKGLINYCHSCDGFHFEDGKTFHDAELKLGYDLSGRIDREIGDNLKHILTTLFKNSDKSIIKSNEIDKSILEAISKVNGIPVKDIHGLIEKNDGIYIIDEESKNKFTDESDGINASSLNNFMDTIEHEAFIILKAVAKRNNVEYTDEELMRYVGLVATFFSLCSTVVSGQSIDNAFKALAEMELFLTDQQKQTHRQMYFAIKTWVEDMP